MPGGTCEGGGLPSGSPLPHKHTLASHPCGALLQIQELLSSQELQKPAEGEDATADAGGL